MTKEPSWFGRWEAYVLAVAPLMGIAIAFFEQVGRFFYLGVPSDLVELDTPRILVSTIGVVVIGLALGAVWLDGVVERAGNAWSDLVGQHATVNVLLGSALIYRTTAGFTQQLLPILLTAAWLTAVSLAMRDLTIRARSSGSMLRLGYSPMVLSVICIAVFATFVGLVMYLGYSGERKVHSRLVIANTHVFLAGTYAGQYVLKPFDPVTRRVLPGAVSLQTPGGQLNLVVTDIDLLPAEGD